MFLSDYVLLKVVKMVMGYRTKEIRICVGALVGSFLSFLTMASTFFMPALSYLLAVPIGISMLGVSFGKKRCMDYVKGLALLIFGCICLGGLLSLLMESGCLVQRSGYLSVLFVAMVWFLYLFLKKGKKWMNELLLHRSQNAEVTLVIQGKKAHCRGFWDSGNALSDPITGKPVVLLEKAILEKYQIPIPVKGFRVIPFRSVGMENGVLKGFVADELFVRDEKGFERSFQRTVIAIYEGRLSIKEEYQMILNPHL